MLRQPGLLGLVAGVLLIIVDASSLTADEAKREFEVHTGATVFTLDATGLEAGQSKTLTKDGHTVVATREGDSLKLKVDDREIQLPDHATRFMDSSDDIRCEVMVGAPGTVLGTDAEMKENILKWVEEGEENGVTLPGEEGAKKIVFVRGDVDASVAEGEPRKIVIVKNVIATGDDSCPQGEEGAQVQIMVKCVGPGDADCAQPCTSDCKHKELELIKLSEDPK